MEDPTYQKKKGRAPIILAERASQVTLSGKCPYTTEGSGPHTAHGRGGPLNTGREREVRTCFLSTGFRERDGGQLLTCRPGEGHVFTLLIRSEKNAGSREEHEVIIIDRT